MDSLPISQFIQDEKNANKGTQEGGKLLEKSLKEFGAGRSIVLDKNNRIVAGNKTASRAIAAGITDAIIVPSDGTKLVAIKRIDLDLELDPKAKELAIADNRIGEVNLDWDFEVLKELGTEVDLTKFWSEEDLARAFESVEQESESAARKFKQKDSDVTEGVEPRCQQGEVWALGKHRLMCGNALDESVVSNLLSGVCPTFVWADPPYGIAIQKKDGGVGGRGKKFPIIAGDDSTETAIASFRLCEKFADAVQVWWGANNYPSVLPGSTCWIVWDKKTEQGDIDGIDFADAELAFVNSSTAVRVFRHLWLGMWKDSEKGEARIHPTQKPIELVKWTFEKYGNSGDVVFDPFLGSGVSIIAAEQMGDRVVCGVELSEHYCETTMQRWEKTSGQKAARVD